MAKVGKEENNEAILVQSTNLTILKCVEELFNFDCVAKVMTVQCCYSI